MPRSYLGRSKNAAMLTISGFGEFASLVEQLEKKGIDDAAKKTFSELTDTLSNTLRQKAKDAEVPQHLISEMNDLKVIGANGGNLYFYSIGWRRRNPDTFLKVCWLNYGTPRRFTDKGAYRGKVAPRYFISNTKRSVKQKFNRRLKEMQKEILAELKK